MGITYYHHFDQGPASLQQKRSGAKFLLVDTNHQTMWSDISRVSYLEFDHAAL